MKTTLVGIPLVIISGSRIDAARVLLQDTDSERCGSMLYLHTDQLRNAQIRVQFNSTFTFAFLTLFPQM